MNQRPDNIAHDMSEEFIAKYARPGTKPKPVKKGAKAAKA
jgi:hypothetical protein